MVVPPLHLNPTGSFKDLLHEALLEIAVHSVVDFVHFLRFFYLFELIMKLKELGDIGLLKKLLVVLHDSLDVILHLL